MCCGRNYFCTLYPKFMQQRTFQTNYTWNDWCWGSWDFMEYDAYLMIDHQIALTGLTKDTRYQFYVESTDWRGRTTMDDNGGV